MHPAQNELVLSFRSRINLRICFVILYFFLSVFLLPKVAKAQTASNLNVDSQLSGATISTPTPTLTWQNPAGNIEAVIVRIRNVDNLDQCASGSITDLKEHWFDTGSDIAGRCAGSTRSAFSSGSPPTSYIIPPGVLTTGQTVYWTVFVKVGGQYRKASTASFNYTQASPTASLSTGGVTNINVGQTVNVSATINLPIGRTIQSASIFIAKVINNRPVRVSSCPSGVFTGADPNNPDHAWCRIGYTTSGNTVAGSWVADAAGAYQIIAAAVDAQGGKCSGSPYVSYPYAGFEDCGNQSRNLINVNDASGPRVNWQPSGSTISDPSPILTWQNPAGNIEAVIVRIRNVDKLDKCAADESVTDLKEHWFYSGSSVSKCPGATESSYSLSGKTPTTYIIPPGVLTTGQTVYWRVYFKIGGNYQRTPIASFTYNPPSLPLSTNKFGVNVNQFYSDKTNTSLAWKDHLLWARNAVGAGGFVKLFFPWFGDADAPLQSYKAVLDETYRLGLTPIVRVDGTWVKGAGLPLGGCWQKPSDSSMNQITDFLRSYTVPDGKKLYVEFWNEMNYDDIEWCDASAYHAREPQIYARNYLDMYNRIKGLNNPKIALMNGGLGRAGYDSYLNSWVDELKRIADPNDFKNELFKNYAVHNYPIHERQRDSQQISDEPGLFHRSPFQFKHELDILDSKGVDVSQTKVFVTEAGVPKFITRTDGTRVEVDPTGIHNAHLVDLWAKDPKVFAINMFTLDDNTDHYVFPTFPSPLEQWLWVENNSTTINNLPSKPTPWYNLLRSTIAQYLPLAATQIYENPVTVSGYTISEDRSLVENSTPPGQPWNPIITFTLSSTPRTKTVFVKFFYSNGTSSDIKQQSIIYRLPPAQDNYQPRGAQGFVNCTRLEGWVCDQDYPDGKIQVDFYKDRLEKDNFLGGVIANQDWYDSLTGQCASGDNRKHGYFQPTSAFPALLDGQTHTILAFAHGVNSQGQQNPRSVPQLNPQSGKQVTCPAPAPTPPPAPTQTPPPVDTPQQVEGRIPPGTE